MMPDQITYPAVIEDASGRGYQYMPETKVPMYDWRTEREWVHTMTGGWWDLAMSRQVDVSEIRCPVNVVWEA